MHKSALGGNIWNDTAYMNSDYKISVIASRGNFFDTVARPFNTWLNKNHRGVSEVITTLLLLAITMVGAVIVSSIVQNSMIDSDHTGGETRVSPQFSEINCI